MALQRYIVDCETEINQPKYLIGHDMPIYDFTCIMPDSAVTKLFPALSTESWPSHDELSFDPSQMDAMKTALTKEIALIQGRYTIFIYFYFIQFVRHAHVSVCFAHLIGKK